jgi:hypothetical protein
MTTRYFYVVVSIVLCSCKAPQRLVLPARNDAAVSGKYFYKRIGAMNREQRESLMIQEILSGNIPKFIRKLISVHVQITDSVTGKIIHATYFVTADYLSVGNNKNFARVPMSPMAAQPVADSLHCFLPTKKMVDDIYRQAKLKLEPHPLVDFRDSAITFYQHHLLIEAQRHHRRGLIAGIKKDVVLSTKINTDSKPNRVAIYGWHQLNGQPIQPLYTGHVNWYVDYSHGIRLVYRIIIVDGKKMDYTAVLKDPLLRRLLCDEANADFLRYTY